MRTKTQRNCPNINDLTTSLLHFSSLGRMSTLFLSRYVFLFVSVQINSFYVRSCMCCAMPIIIILLYNHGQENVGSHQKKIPHIQGQRRIPIRW